jgi:hypothetical protein
VSTELWFTVTIVSAGLWSGLLLTITTILHPMYAAEDGTGFTRDLHRFLPVARRSPTNYLLVIGLLVGPAATLASLWDDRGSTAFVLTAIGLALTVIGPFFVSRFVAEPNYEVIMGWDEEDLPEDWTSVRRRYFALNWIRGVLTWVAFACFLAAASAQVQ